MKTDLTKILSVSGHSGLFRLISQSRGGVVVEALTDQKRTWFGPSAKITSLQDISIYKDDGEMTLMEMLESMKAFLNGAEAPVDKTHATTMQDFFAQVVPDYDRSRFYPSHMVKVAEWFNLLLHSDALDFEKPEPEETPENAPQTDEANQ